MTTTSNVTLPNVASGATVFAGIPNLALAEAVASLSDASPNAAAFTIPNINDTIDTGIHGQQYLLAGAGSLYIDWCSRMDFDPVRRIAALSGAPAGNSSGGNTQATRDEATVLKYDALSNALHVTRNPFNENVGHSYNSSAMNTLHGLLYKSPYNAQGAGDPTSDVIFAWDYVNNVRATDIPRPPTTVGGSAGWNSVKPISVFPTMGAQGSLIWVNASGGRVLRWDIATASVAGDWTLISNDCSFENEHIVIEYMPEVDLMVFTGTNGTSVVYTMDRFGHINDLGVPLHNLADPAIEIATNGNAHLFSADPSGSGEMILVPNYGSGTSYPDKHWALNLVTGNWTDLGTIPAALKDPVHTSEETVPICIRELNCWLCLRWGGSGTSTAIVYRRQGEVL